MPGKPVTQRDVQAADVDAQLERLRRDDGVELVGEQAPLDVAPLLRRIAGAVRLHAFRCAAAASVLEAAAHVPVHQLRRLARRRERDHTRAGQHALRGDVARFRQRAASHTRSGVLEWWVPEDDRAFGTRGLVLVHRGERRADEAFREALRVGDGRRGEDEARVRTVLPAEPPQPADDLGDVAAEDAAVHVRLVEHHVPQLMQELRPAFVARQDADVEHVRVAEEDGRSPSSSGRWSCGVSPS